MQELLADPLTLVNSLNAQQIAERIAELGRQQRALMVLLRAARRRGRDRADTPKAAAPAAVERT
jgi:hypothetical protein